MKRCVPAIIASLAAACSGVNLFNTLAPRDSGVKRVASGIAFGSDPRQTLDIYAPTAKAKPAVIVFIYGGSWATGRRQDYGFAASALAARGYVTVVADYRLVPAVRFPSFIEDGASAVAWVHKNAQRFGADPRRIVLIGHSAGAYNVAMLALNPAYLQTAGVDMSAIRAVVGLAGPYDFYPWDTQVSRNAFGNAADPAATQPVTFARADAPPMLLLTGDADTTVRPRNTRALATKLAGLGAPVQTKFYPGTNHAGILLNLTPSFRNRAPVLDDIVTFVDAQTR